MNILSKRFTVGLHFIFGAVICMSISCVDGGADVGNVYVVPISDACAIDAQGTQVLSTDTFDPMGGGAYALNIKWENRLAANDAATLEGPAGPVEQQNSVTLLGYDICFFRTDKFSVDSFDGNAGDLGCDDSRLSKARRFIPSSGTANPGDQLVSTLDVLTPSDLKVLYGDVFDATTLSMAGSGSVVSGKLAPRNPADPWGTFPDASIGVDKSTVVIRMRASLEGVTGSKLHSSWFSFPVDVIPGAFADACQPLNIVPCTTEPLACAGTDNPCNAVGVTPATVIINSCAIVTGNAWSVAGCFGTCGGEAQGGANAGGTCMAYGAKGEQLDAETSCFTRQLSGQRKCLVFDECEIK